MYSLRAGELELKERTKRELRFAPISAKFDLSYANSVEEICSVRRLTYFDVRFMQSSAHNVDILHLCRFNRDLSSHVSTKRQFSMRCRQQTSASSLFVLLNTYLHMKNSSSGEDRWQLRWIEGGLQLFTCRWWPLHYNYFATNAKGDKWRETKAALWGFAAAIIPESAFRTESLRDSAWHQSSFLLFVCTFACCCWIK